MTRPIRRSLDNELAGGHVHRRTAMRHHLRDVHLAPLPLRRRLKLVNPRDQGVDRGGLKEIVHANPSTLPNSKDALSSSWAGMYTQSTAESQPGLRRKTPCASIISLFQHHHAQAGMVPRLSGSPNDARYRIVRGDLFASSATRGFGHGCSSCHRGRAPLRRCGVPTCRVAVAEAFH